MATTKVTLLGSIAWAAVMLASAYLFKGHRLGDWIDSALLFAFICWLSTRSACPARATGKC
jgi:hypothetical protein